MEELRLLAGITISTAFCDERLPISKVGQEGFHRVPNPGLRKGFERRSRGEFAV